MNHLPLLPEFAELQARIAAIAADFPDGVPGVRSVNFPCEHFDGLTPDGSGDCHSDGHYLCHECSRMSRKSDRWPDEGNP
jgi:hypothetical protein